MLGNYFYNERIRKAVAVFGSLFNDIYVQRKDASGGVISQIKVPLSYAPKRDFVDRIAQTTRGEDQERQIAIKLPRMSFEILAITYDPTRQLPKLNKRTVPVETNSSAGKKVYTPVPYNIQFQLNIYARSQDDALQVVEQILPSFNPQYSVSVKPLEGFDLQEDTPIKLDAVTFQDDFEGVIEQRRTIIYTLDFEMKVNLYRDVNATSSLIKSVEASLYDFDTGGLLSYIQCDANTITGNSASINEDAGSTSDRILFEQTLNPLYRDSADADGTIQQVTIGSPFSIASGDSADNGTSTITGDGTWTYTPEANFFGTDTFDVTVDVGQNVTETVTVTVNVANVDDAVDDAFTVFNNIPTVVNVAANESISGTLTHSVETTPTNGSVVVEDATAGTFRYTANASYTGADNWEYRVTPDPGTGEVAAVDMTVLAALTYSVSIPNSVEGATVDATITTNVANGQTLSWAITGDNTTNGRITTTSGTVVMDATTKTVPIVIYSPAGSQGTVSTTFTVTDNSPQYPNTTYAVPPTASGTFDILDSFYEDTYQAPSPTNSGDFSFALASNEDYLIIGEPGTEKAYRRALSDGTTIELTGATGETGYFGRAVAISDDSNLIAVGAMNTGTAAARVHLFDNTGTYIDGITGPTGDRWGTQVAITDNYLLVSEPRGDAVGNNSGQIYVYPKTSPFTLLDTFDYDLNIPNGDYIGLTLATSPSNTDQFVAGGHASPVRLGKIVSDAQQYTNFLDTHDNVAGIWSSHYDADNTFSNGPTSLAMSANHVFIGVPKLNRVSVWRYADPVNGNFGTLGATSSTPRIDGSFTVANSGNSIDLGAQAPDLVAGRVDPENITIGDYDGFWERSGTNTWNAGNGGIAWIRNKDTDEYIIARVARDASGFPQPDNPTAIRLRTVNWTTDGNEPAGSPAIPGYTSDGTYNLQISMIAQFSHLITIPTGETPSGETDIKFGWQVAVNGDNTELYVAAPRENFETNGNRGVIYRFTLDDTVDVGFDRELAVDTIATRNGYLRGEQGDNYGSGDGANTYFWGGGAIADDFNDGAPVQLIANSFYLHLGNPVFNNNQGRVLENPFNLEPVTSTTFSGSHTYDPEFGWCAAILNVDTAYESATRTKQDFGIPADGLTMTLDSIMRDADWAQVLNDATYITFDIVDPSGSPQNTLPSQRETNGVVFTKAAITTEPNISGTNVVNADDLGRETIKSGIRTFWHDEDVGDDFNTNDQSGFVFRSNELRLYGNSALGSNEVQQRGNTGQQTGTSTGDYVNWGTNQYLLVWVTNSSTAPVLKAAP